MKRLDALLNIIKPSSLALTMGVSIFRTLPATISKMGTRGRECAAAHLAFRVENNSELPLACADAAKNNEKFGTLHEFACHPCAGAMLIFSVSFQF